MKRFALFVAFAVLLGISACAPRGQNAGGEAGQAPGQAPGSTTTAPGSLGGATTSQTGY